MRLRLEERQHVGMAAGALHQEIGVAPSRQPRLLRAVVQAGQMVGRFLDEATDVTPGGLGQRGLREERRPRVGRPRRRRTQEPVGAERLAVEEDGRAHVEPSVEATIEHAVPARDVHAQLGEQRTRDRAVRRRAVDGERAAVADQRATADPELVAARVSAEVVVVVEDEDARGGAGNLAKEPGRGQPADASAHDHQIVALAGIGGRTGAVPERPVAQRVGDFERSVVAAAEARQRGRIGRRTARRLVEAEPERLARREQRPAHGERDAVQEVASRQTVQGLVRIGRAPRAGAAVSAFPAAGPRRTVPDSPRRGP